MKQEIKVITPEWAKFILDNSNTENRKLRMSWVRTLSSAIDRGEWQITHQGIAFDEDGMLLDGQHRLSAIVKSGKSVSMYVTTGLQSDSFKVIDAHAKRSIADLTKLPRKTAEVCKSAAHYAYNENVSPDVVKMIADAGVASIHNELMKFCGTGTAVFSSTSIRLMACMLILKDSECKDYVMSSYRRLCIHDFVNMNSYEAGFARRVAAGLEKAVGFGATSRLLAISRKCFDQKNMNLSKIYISDSDIKEAAYFVRHTILELLK